jgi:hypothetical protein
MTKASRRLTLAPGTAIGGNNGLTANSDLKRDAERNMAGVTGDDYNEITPVLQGNCPPLFTNSAPIGSRLVEDSGR